MKKYRVVGKTNSYIAQRDIQFNGKTEVVFEDNLAKREAQLKVMEFFRMDYADELGGMWMYSNNWGLFRINDNRTWTDADGCYGYEYDSRYISMEEYDDEQEND